MDKKGNLLTLRIILAAMLGYLIGIMLKVVYDVHVYTGMSYWEIFMEVLRR